MLYSGSAQERSYTAGGLKAYEEYSFTVTVCNRQGCANSPPASGRTLSSGQYIPIIYIQCTLQAAFDVMFLNCWICHSHLCRLPIGLKFSFSNAISSLIQTIRTNPNCSTFKNSRFIMEYTHSVWALNIQLRVSALIYVVVKRRKTWIGVNSYVNINEVPLMGSVCHCSYSVCWIGLPQWRPGQTTFNCVRKPIGELEHIWSALLSTERGSLLSQRNTN